MKHVQRVRGRCINTHNLEAKHPREKMLAWKRLNAGPRALAELRGVRAKRKEEIKRKQQKHQHLRTADRDSYKLLPILNFPSSTSSAQNNSLSSRLLSWPTSTTKAPLCHLFLILPVLLVVLINAAGPAGAETEPSMPPFVPTRAPAQQQVAASRSDSSAVPSGSSSKFHRINELDVFLDEMNHNELRAVASGKPIGDLFRSKPAAQVGGPSLAEAEKEKQLEDKEQQQAKQRQQQRNGRQSEGLEGSQSQQQIYSECALILQRTYVKNIDDPK